jgi:DNA polymerase/3'-5' exonuclease PolX
MSILQLTQTIHILPSIVPPARRQSLQPALPGMEPQELEHPTVTNRQIAEVLSDIADLLEQQNGNPYRIQAYRNAARGVLDLQEAAADILARGERLPIPGLGSRLRAHIAELVHNGAMTIQDGLCLQTLPKGVRALMAVEHIGPYTAIRLYEELGIDTPEKLWRAANQHRICQLYGFGERSEARLKEAVGHLLKGPQRPPVHNAA